MWSEGGTQGTRNGEIRIKEAIALGANVMATACPFCLLTFEDSTKTAGLTEKIVVKDITELVSEAL
jgi:Fe-S oxidoreductase